MYLHREGRKIIAITMAALLLTYAAMIFFVHKWTLFHFVFVLGLLVLEYLIIRFFRIPRRISTEDKKKLIAPADGTIVVMEDVYEKEYIKEECLQISIFMSPMNVHVNRYPCDGLVEYVKYHRGNYFVASYPKSSVLNERASVGLRLAGGQKILLRQVAGVMARRIVCYAREGEEVKQNQEMGFIKFGSRVDLFIPKDFETMVDLQDVVKNTISPIAIVH